MITADKLPFDELVQAFEKHGETLPLLSKWKDYLEALEKLVNIGKSKRRVLY